MNVAAMQALSAVLALAAAALAAAVVILWVARQRAAAAAAAFGALGDAALWLAFLIAAGATAGSLYFSEVANYTPCPLCWFQRIAMYPLTAVLLVAAIRGDRTAARWYVLPLSTVGAALSTYHYLIEWRPSLEATACGVGPSSCTFVWFREFGFVTLALMALCGFVAITALVSAAASRPADSEASR